MAYVPVSRAAALPGRYRSSAAQSPRWTLLSDHALLRGDRAAHLLVRDDEVVIRPWSETARVVELAAAGLVRSGLRVDQVVVSLVPPGHACPELDLALRAIGAVVVHVDPHAGPDDLRASSPASTYVWWSSRSLATCSGCPTCRSRPRSSSRSTADAGGTGCSSSAPSA